MEGRAPGDIRSYVEEIIDPAETFKDDVKNGDLREDNRYEFADDFEKGWQNSTGASTGVERGELAEYFEELIVEDQKSAESEVQSRPMITAPADPERDPGEGNAVLACPTCHRGDQVQHTEH